MDSARFLQYIVLEITELTASTTIKNKTIMCAFIAIATAMIMMIINMVKGI